MRQYFSTLALVLMASLTNLNGQNANAPEAWSYRVNYLNYLYTLDQQHNRDDIRLGAEIEYTRNLNTLVNLSIPIRMSKALIPTDKNGTAEDHFLAGLDGLVELKYFKPQTFIYPYLYGGLGFYTKSFDDVQLSIPFGLGLNFRLAPGFYLSTKSEYRVGFTDLHNNIQLGTGVRMILSGQDLETPPQDMDKDGVPDAQDLCPTVAGPAPTSGCPDADNDGIADGADQCPNEAGPVATKGCPDTDGDGIANKDDKCPTEKGTASTMGCPDNDGDGIANADDKCPNEAGPVATMGCPDSDGDGVIDRDDNCPAVAGLANLKGCPDADGDGIADKDDTCPTVRGEARYNGCPDTDGDGVSDNLDKCPNTAGPASNSGCPEIKEEDKKILSFATQAVNFETGSATITKSSYKILDQVADILKRYPDYKCQISGHTDNVGDELLNQALSDRRAKACNDYLINKGIDRTRLGFAGYGETRPIADNNTKAGRDKNRRVEFELKLD